MQELDVELPGILAPHRTDESIIPDLLYPAHAMISVPTRAMANMLCKQTQAHFDNNRRNLPAAAGWNAKSIFLSDGELPGDILTEISTPGYGRTRNSLTRTKCVTRATASARECSS